MRKEAFVLAALFTVGAGVVLLPACGGSLSGSTVVTGTGLATSCGTDDDCVGVYFGDVCPFCATTVPNAAIASSAETAYQNEVNAARAHCAGARAAGSCIRNETITTCAMGTCTLTTCADGVASAHACAPAIDAGGGDASGSGSTVLTATGFASSCSVDDDCIGVYFGDVCGLCTTAVPNAAIASSGVATYENEFNAAVSSCPPIRIAGSCIQNETITTCVTGTCMLTTCTDGVATAHACASSDAGDAGTNR